MQFARPPVEHGLGLARGMNSLDTGGPPTIPSRHLSAGYGLPPTELDPTEARP